MNASAANLQVEKVLDDLISKLTKAASSPESKAALIEARRLRNVTLRWAAIPPPPDARREMLTRVMELVSKAGLKASVPPAAPSSPPPAPKPSAAPPPKRSMSQEIPAALGGFGSSERVAIREAEPTTAETIEKKPFRVDASTTRQRREGGAPKRAMPPDRLPELDEVAPPRPAARSISEPPTSPAPPQRNLSPIPGRSFSPERSFSPGRSFSPAQGIPAQRSAAPPAEATGDEIPSVLGGGRIPSPARGFGARSLSPLPGQRTPSPPRGVSAAPAAGRFATGTGSATMQYGRASDIRRQLEAEGAMRPSAPPTKKADALEFDLDGPASSPPRSPQGASQPPTPRMDPSLLPRLGSETPAARKPPHRAHTIAGIPEANEAMAQALLGRRVKSEESESFDEIKRRSNMPTAAPPPPSNRTGAIVSGAGPSSSGAPPPLRGSAPRHTLAMGALDASAALAALGQAKSPRLPEDELHEKPPSTKPSTAPTSGRAPSGAEHLTPPPISAVGAQREGKFEGLSSSVSSPAMPAARKASSQTQMMGTPPPPGASGSQPPEKSLRTVVAPGVTIVRPDAAQWQPHPEVAGVTIKVLYRDPRSGIYSALLRLAPGSTLPRRRHAASEEMLLVSGIAAVGMHEMRAGEYSRAEADTTHEPITTTTGCTFFLTGSEHDEFVEGE